MGNNCKADADLISKADKYITKYKNALIDTKNVMSITSETINNINIRFECIDKYIDKSTNEISSEGFNLTDIEVNHLNIAIKKIDTKIVNNKKLHSKTEDIVQKWMKFCEESIEIKKMVLQLQQNNNPEQYERKLRVNLLAGFVKCAWFLATVMVTTGGGILYVPAIILSGKYLHNQEDLIKHENACRIDFMNHTNKLNEELKKIKVFAEYMNENVKDFETKQTHIINGGAPKFCKDPITIKLIGNLRRQFKEFAKSQNDIKNAVDKIIL